MKLPGGRIGLGRECKVIRCINGWILIETGIGW